MRSWNGLRLELGLLLAMSAVGCGGANESPSETPESLGVAQGALSPIQSMASGTVAPTMAGSTQGAFSVTGQGRVSYAVGIRVPPGSAGMAPALSLAYSPGVNGYAGHGWSLQGLSAITRCAQTRAQDGVARAVTNDASDRFCFDGARLVLVATTTRPDNKQAWEYRTELEGYSQIFAVGTVKHNPDYWIVRARSGQQYFFGSTPDSRMTSPSTECAGPSATLTAVGTSSVTTPPGVTAASLTAIGGGGGGGGGSWSNGTSGDAYTGGGGGSGGVARGTYRLSPGETLSVVVGGGGYGGPPHNGNVASPGGTSVVTGTFGQLVASGGKPGVAGYGGTAGRGGLGGAPGGVSGAAVGGCGTAPGGDNGSGSGRGGAGQCGSASGQNAAPGLVRICWGPPLAKSWALAKAMDRKGNYFTVQYQSVSTLGETIPLRVNYTGNDSVPGQIADNQSIQFFYEARPDTIQGYDAGDSVQNTVRLTRIQSYVNRTELATDLRLAYTQGASGKSLLSAVQECGAEGCLPETKFQYTPSNTTFATPASFGTGHSVDDGVGDFDGDGRSDLWDIRSGQVYISLSNGTAFATPVAWPGGAGFGGDRKAIYAIDFNFDNKTDFIQFDTAGNASVWLASGNATVGYSFAKTNRGPTTPPAPTQLLSSDWQRIPAAGLPPGTYEFLYHQPSSGNWYRSPAGNVAWSWSQFQPLCGTYTWGRSGSPVVGGTVSLVSGESGTYGVGCSLGPGANQKVLPWQSGAPNATASQGIVCQDAPNLFGTPCALADFYFRPAVERVYNFGNDPKRLVLGDFDGDHRMDVLRFDPNGKAYVFYQDANGFLPGSLYASDWSNLPMESIKTGDFDGNGTTDLLVMEPDGRLTMRNLMGTAAAWAVSSGLTALEIQVADINGDRKDDLVRFAGDGNAYISVSTGRGFQPFAQALTDARLGDVLVDIDGDGRSDLYRIDATTGQATWARGQGGLTGDKFAAWAPLLTMALPQTTVTNPTTPGCTSADARTFCLNSGYADVASFTCGTRSVTTTCNTGGYSTSCTKNVSYMATAVCVQKFATLMADMNGDGRVDPMVTRADGTAWGARGNNPHGDALRAVREGNGREQSITYATVVDPSVYWRAAADPAYPRISYVGAMPLVSSLGESDGNGGTRWTYFAYSDAQMDLSGRGFLGFRSMVTRRSAKAGANTPSGRGGVAVREVQYLQAFPYSGQVTGTYDRWEPNGTADADARSLGYAINAYGVKTLLGVPGEPPRYFVYTTRSESGAKDLNGIDMPVNVGEFTYDDWGSLTQSVSSVGPRGGPAYRLKTLLNEYAPADTSNWILGRIRKATVTHDAGDQAAAQRRVRTSTFDYDTAGFLVRETVEPNDPASTLITETSYDAYGHASTVTVKDAAGTTRTSSSRYDAQGRFKIETTNAVGHVSKAEYDPRTGAVVKTTAPNGTVQAATWDWTGQPLSETNAFGVVRSHSYTYVPPGSGPMGLGGIARWTTVTAGPGQFLFVDILGRDRQAGMQRFDGRWVYRNKVYDAIGNLVSETQPHMDGETPLSTAYEHDALGRVVKITEPNGGVSSHSFSGLSETFVNALGQSTVRTTYPDGTVASVRDPANGTVSFVYDTLGNPVQTIDPAGNVTKMVYDIRGHRTQLTDPDMGITDTKYNAFGEAVEEVRPLLRAAGKKNTTTYDGIGRIQSRSDGGEVSTWTYDTCANGVGQLCAVSGPQMNYRREYTYNAKGQPLSEFVTISSWVVNSWTTSTTYDIYGRPDVVTYPSGFKVQTKYNPIGYVAQMVDGTTLAPLWTQNETDVYGASTKETLGNGLVTRRNYHPRSHALESTRTALNDDQIVSVQNQKYAWDAIGNLSVREDLQNGVSEAFAYDELSRVKSSQVTKFKWAIPGAGAPANVSFAYDAIGNMTFKSDVGTYTYNAIRAGSTEKLPHAVSQAGARAGYTYDADGNVIGGDGLSMAWKTFDAVEFMSKTTSANNVSGAAYYYGPSRERIVHRRLKRAPSVSTWTNIDETYYVSPAFEETRTAAGKVTQRHYVGAGSSMIQYTVEKQSDSTFSSFRYLLRDHLGSLSTVTDGAGKVVSAESFSFDLFGRRRGLDCTALSGPVTSVVSRGYTGHEMLEDFGLVHMNGRIQDPVLGRFLSADPFVQYPESTQSYNRYAYLSNNPLNATDPTGYLSLKKLFRAAVTVAAVVAATVVIPGMGLLEAAAALNYATTGKFSWKATLWTAVAIAASASIGVALGPTAPFLVNAFFSGVVSGTIASLQGGDFESAFASGFMSSAMGGAGGMAASGMQDVVTRRVLGGAISIGIGGFSSTVGGGKFASGARSAAFAYLMGQIQSENRTASADEWSQPANDSGPVGWSVDNYGGPGAGGIGASPGSGLSGVHCIMIGPGSICGNLGLVPDAYLPGAHIRQLMMRAGGGVGAPATSIGSSGVRPTGGGNRCVNDVINVLRAELGLKPLELTANLGLGASTARALISRIENYSGWKVAGPAPVSAEGIYLLYFPTPNLGGWQHTAVATVSSGTIRVMDSSGTIGLSSAVSKYGHYHSYELK